MTELELRVTGSHFTSNDPALPAGWTLRVEDALSSTVLVDVQLGPVDFQRILAGGQVAVTGHVARDLHRVGRKMRNWSVPIPQEHTPRYNEPDDCARAWAAENSPEPFDTIEIRRQNTGTIAIYRRWD